VAQGVICAHEVPNKGDLREITSVLVRAGMILILSFNIYGFSQAFQQVQYHQNQRPKLYIYIHTHTHTHTAEVPKHQQSVQLIDVQPDDSPRILTDLVQYFFFIIL
jgi:hypothetical protein